MKLGAEFGDDRRRGEHVQRLEYEVGLVHLARQRVIFLAVHHQPERDEQLLLAWPTNVFY